MCDLATKFSGKLVIFFGFLRSSFISSWSIHCSSSVSFFSDSLWLRFGAKKLSNVRTRFRCDILLHFSQTREFLRSKANWRLRFSLPSIILTELLGNNTLLSRVQKVMVYDLWLVDFNPFRVFLCFKVRCLWSRAAKKNNCEGGFWTFEFACLWKAQ